MRNLFQISLRRWVIGLAAVHVIMLLHLWNYILLNKPKISNSKNYFIKLDEGNDKIEYVIWIWGMNQKQTAISFSHTPTVTGHTLNPLYLKR